MKIPLKIHNIIDYIAAVALLASPYLFDFVDIIPMRNIYFILGGGLAVYSALTRYPISAAKVIPVNLHMGFDVSAGLLLMVAPWLLDYANVLSSFQLGLHFVYGIGVLGLVFFTYPIEQSEIYPLSSRQGV